MRLHPGINQLLKDAVNTKWPDEKKRVWWYTKLAVVRATKLRKCSESQNHRCCYCQRRGEQPDPMVFWEVRQGLRPAPKKTSKVVPPDLVIKKAIDHIHRLEAGNLKLAAFFQTYNLWWWLDSWMAHEAERRLTTPRPVLVSKRTARKYAAKEIEHGQSS